MRVLLITPPMVQINTPYAATPALTAFLRSEGVDAVQVDLSLELALRLFSRRGLRQVRDEIGRSRRRRTESVRGFLANWARYMATVDEVVRYLQSGDRKSGEWIASDALPVGPRFRVLDDLRNAGVGVRCVEDGRAEPAKGVYARFLASLYVDDLADAVREGVDSGFGLSRYAERLAAAAPSFTPLRRALTRPPGLLDRMLDDLTVRLLRRVRPDVVGITIPFPGNVYAALRIAKAAKAWNPRVRIVAGGGYVNTELRWLSDPRVFDYWDFVTYDDGEIPFLKIVRYLGSEAPQASLVRTRFRSGGEVVYVDAGGPALRHGDRPAPCYDGLPLDRYCGMVETLNPMARLWAERRWIKLALAHGCYWHRCAFCDTGLDYIARYDPADAPTIVNWIDELCRATGERGFHFVDEAAPPAVLRRVAEELIRRKMNVTWWTNIRFEKSFTPDLARLLARSGCIAVTGGLECAEPRLLGAMGKCVPLPQAARVAHAFASAGILVHAYLMYGFPGQTEQETVDALEVVRQLFRAGCLHSAYWHRFALTVHSPIYRDPRRFGIRVGTAGRARFARNEAAFTDGKRTDHAELGRALHRAAYNYMSGVGIDEDARLWFESEVPRPRLRKNAVAQWIKPARRKDSGHGREPR